MGENAEVEYHKSCYFANNTMNAIYSKRRISFIHPSILRKVRAGHSRIKTMSRASVIRRDFAGKVFYVHCGNSYRPVHINEEMVGHRLGEFAVTKKMCVYKRKKKKKRFKS